MAELERISLSLDRALLKRLAKALKSSGYANRSEFFRDMIRRELVAREWDEDRETVGTITLVYDHHTRTLNKKLTDLQHHFHHEVLATTHVHLDEDMCVEVIILQGRAGKLRRLANLLGQQKGVLHANLTCSSTGRNLA